MRKTINKLLLSAGALFVSRSNFSDLGKGKERPVLFFWNNAIQRFLCLAFNQLNVRFQYEMVTCLLKCKIERNSPHLLFINQSNVNHLLTKANIKGCYDRLQNGIRSLLTKANKPFHRKRLYRLFNKTALPKMVLDLLMYYHTMLIIYARKHLLKKYREKPNQKLSQQYKNYRMLIRLRHWRVTSQAESLIQTHYANKPKNPV